MPWVCRSAVQCQRGMAMSQHLRHHRRAVQPAPHARQHMDRWLRCTWYCYYQKNIIGIDYTNYIIVIINTNSGINIGFDSNIGINPSIDSIIGINTNIGIDSKSMRQCAMSASRHHTPWPSALLRPSLAPKSWRVRRSRNASAP